MRSTQHFLEHGGMNGKVLHQDTPEHPYPYN